ncbi:MAG: beta-N-acetylglucosaminidase domain-containing protein [Deltaproteobacteria bacterium]|nr:beta-N-acetylglucosaminidase domain-containing protein [Deltaproteobacteria bacterium]
MTFQRCGIVEGFFGPPWSMSHRAAMFQFAAKRGMNTYLYAPKDDPYHRERWREPYPESEWKELLKLIRLARERRIDFVYGFHPGKGLHFAAAEPVDIMLTKAQRFYDAGVRTFAILFDDIPSRLKHAEDQKTYGGSHVRGVAKRIKRRLMLWDNYPVNDLSMSSEMHLGPLTGRDPRLPESVYGYLNNPLLQEELSFIPLATCFDYAANPSAYDPEESWNRVIEERFGRGALDHWKAIRAYCERAARQKHKNRALTLPSKHRNALEAAHRYLLKQRERGWVAEFRPWLELMERSLSGQRKA